MLFRIFHLNFIYLTHFYFILTLSVCTPNSHNFATHKFKHRSMVQLTYIQRLYVFRILLLTNKKLNLEVYCMLMSYPLLHLLGLAQKYLAMKNVCLLDLLDLALKEMLLRLLLLYNELFVQEIYFVSLNYIVFKYCIF